MRTTLSISDDVLDRARKAAEVQGRPFKEVVNEALRAGLTVLEHPPAPQPYRTDATALGLLPGRNLDNIQELLAHIEGEAAR